MKHSQLHWVAVWLYTGIFIKKAVTAVKTKANTSPIYPLLDKVTCLRSYLLRQKRWKHLCSGRSLVPYVTPEEHGHWTTSRRTTSLFHLHVNSRSWYKIPLHWWLNRCVNAPIIINFICTTCAFHSHLCNLNSQHKPGYLFSPDLSCIK